MDQMTPASLPLVGLPADTFHNDGLLFHSVGDKYLRAVSDVARCHGVVLAATGDGHLDDLLDHLSGVVVTGAPSNVHPPHYGAEPDPDHEPYDHGRDGLTLALIGKVLARAIPLLCICRGFQELNVVLGGTLEGEIQRRPGRLDHRAPVSDDLDVRYGPVHAIDITPGGELEAILATGRIMVNSVHRQGIARLAESLKVEALSPDGVIEAASVRGAPAFALGVQWHPEYKASANPSSVKLFEAFGDAARRHARLSSPSTRAVGGTNFRRGRPPARSET